MSALTGMRVLELGQLVAGPFAGAMLGHFGAEVIKIEGPGGDPIRRWRGIDDDGTSLWWRSVGRDKRSVVIDLHRAQGQELVRRLCGTCDVLIENFRPGTLETWNLDPAALRSDNPKLIVARVSGFGQTGPAARRPGFAAVCEAFAGLRFLTGMPGGVTVRPNLSLGDSLAGLHAVIGILLALEERRRSGQGQIVDVSIVESVLNVLESVIPECDRLGVVRQASGRTITGVVPTGSFPCRGGREVIIGANSEPVFRRLCRAMGRESLADDARFSSNESRVENQAELETLIAAWTSGLEERALLEALETAEVPCAPINDARALLADPHLEARDVFEHVDVAGRPLAIPRFAPRLDRSPGSTREAGPDLGAHTDEVLRDLGLSETDLVNLRESGVVA